MIATGKIIQMIYKELIPNANAEVKNFKMSVVYKGSFIKVNQENHK